MARRRSSFRRGAFGQPLGYGAVIADRSPLAHNTFRARVPKPKPKMPPQPPAGFYDPALEAALGAARRGYGDLRADYTRDYGADGKGGRAFNDYQTGLADLQTGRTRLLQDFATNRDRFTQDRNSALANVGLAYGRLARRQGELQRQSGDLSGGLALQAARIRAANEARDQAPITTAFQREMTDLQTNANRAAQGFNRQQAQLGLGYQRSQTDAGTNLERAGREKNQFGIDTRQSEFYQATQAGWTPPRRRRRRRGHG